MPDQPNIFELTNVILELSKDRQKAEAFRRDPEAYLEQAGVSDDLRRLMTSGQQTVEAAIRGTGLEPAVAIIVVVIVVIIHVGGGGGGGGHPPKKPT